MGKCRVTFTNSVTSVSEDLYLGAFYCPPAFLKIGTVIRSI
jgi:hypothetical protein